MGVCMPNTMHYNHARMQKVMFCIVRPSLGLAMALLTSIKSGVTPGWKAGMLQA